MNVGDPTLRGSPRRGVPRSVSDLTDQSSFKFAGPTAALRDAKSSEPLQLKTDLHQTLDPNTLRPSVSSNGSGGHFNSFPAPKVANISTSRPPWATHGSPTEANEIRSGTPQSQHIDEAAARNGHGRGRQTDDDSFESIDSAGVDKKSCNHPTCNKIFSKNALMRKLQRHRCKSCNQYFCSAHKKRAHHACKLYLEQVNQNANIKQTMALWSYAQVPHAISSDDDEDDNDEGR